MASNQYSSTARDPDLPPEDIRQFEAWISSARDYVVPTDDLRPRVLESASSVTDSRLTERRIGYAIIAIAIGCMCWAGLWLCLIEIRTEVVNNSADSISRRALELHEQESISIHHATVDAYEEWRARIQRSAPQEPMMVHESKIVPGAM